MPQTLYLAAHAHAAAVNGDLVFLDVAHDAYVCLPDGARSAHVSEDTHCITGLDPDLAGDLLAAGLLVDRPSRAPAVGTGWRSPNRTALHDDYPRPHLSQTPEALAALADIALHYRGRRFDQILDATQQARTRAPTIEPALLRAVDSFHAWIPYLPAPGKCLLRSFTLLRHLRRQGHDALWVFGVRTWPFHAHCWLQCEDMVLDDQPDRLRAYTPIMVV